jgi:spermidine synthase
VSVLPHADPRPVDLRFSGPAFGLGALASVLQILLLRECAAHFFGNEMTFGFVLAGWLFWGGLGSLWASRRETTAAGLARVFYAVLILAPIGFLGLRFSRFALGLAPGELIGPGWILVAATVLTFFLNAPLGAAFAFAAKIDGPATRTYFWESAGAAAGGLLAYFVLIPCLSNASAATLGGAAAALFIFFSFGRRRAAGLALAALSVLAGLALLDGATQRLAWRPFSLIHSEDSRYGRLQVIRTAEQMTFYDNGLKAFSSPDPASAEEAVHFALLQIPLAGRVLLVGGGAGGSLAEILKYPKADIDYVELDPAVIRLARRYLAPDERAPLEDPRVRLHFADGRAFLERASGRFEAIIVDLPEPATAQLNRYYSLEFFRAAREHLVPGGVLSFRVPSAENYLNPILRRFLATLAKTLRQVFPEVQIVPGATNVFLASDRPLSLDPGVVSERARSLGFRAASVSPAVLQARLDPRRVAILKEAAGDEAAAVNTDLRPVSYFFNAVLWSAQFRGWYAGILSSLASLPARLLLAVFLIILGAILLFLRLRSKRVGAILGSLAVMGLTSLAVEVMILVWFQSRFGFVYERIALLLAVFMAGLAGGAFGTARRKAFRPALLVLHQSVIVLLLIAARPVLTAKAPEAFFFIFLGALGFANGGFFVSAQSLFLREREASGRGYGWDLLGSFAGAVAVAAILIPLAGLPLIFQSLIILNSLALVMLLFLGG